MRTWKRVGDDRYIAVNEKKTGDGTWQTEWKSRVRARQRRK